MTSLRWPRMAGGGGWLDSFWGRPQATDETPSAWDDYWYNEFGATGEGGVKSAAQAMRIIAVKACVRVISESLASLPFAPHRRTGENTSAVAYAHPLYDLIHDQPNDWQTAQEWREMMTAWAMLDGNAYSEILPGPRGSVDKLEPIHPSLVTIYWNTKRRRAVYEITDQADGSKRRITMERMLHLRNLGSEHPVVGDSTITQAKNALTLAQRAEQYGKSFYENESTPGGVLETPNELTEAGYKRLKADWAAHHEGPMNFRKPAILEQGMKWNSLQVTQQDAQYLETRKFSVDEIARLFRVPPHKIGHLDKATYSNIEMQNIEFVTDTLRPWCTRWEQVVRRDLITRPQTFFVRHNVNALLRGDVKTRFEAYWKARIMGVYNANEIRSLEDRNPRTDPDGDTYWTPANMMRDGEEPAPVPKQLEEGDEELDEEEAEDDDNDDEGGDDGGGDSEDEKKKKGKKKTTKSLAQRKAQQQVVRARLRDIVYAQAERIVRKEVGEVRKGLKRAEGNPEALAEWLEGFYQKHAVFVASCLQVPHEEAAAYAGSQREMAKSLGEVVLDVWEIESPKALTAMALGEGSF